MTSYNSIVPAIILSFGIALSASATVSAKDIALSVPSGRASAIGHISLVSTYDCSYLGRPTVTYPNAPEHGTVSIAWTQSTFSKTSDSLSCKGKFLKGMSIVYRPAAGFRGTDTFTIGLRSVYHGTNSYYHGFDYIITVK